LGETFSAHIFHVNHHTTQPPNFGVLLTYELASAFALCLIEKLRLREAETAEVATLVLVQNRVVKLCTFVSP